MRSRIQSLAYLTSRALPKGESSPTGTALRLVLRANRSAMKVESNENLPK